MPKDVRKKNADRRRLVIPYVKGFIPPTDRQRTHALHSSDLGEKLSRELLSERENHFSPIPQPTSIDDWLAQYKEDGQTYHQFLLECPWLSSRKIKYYKSSFVSSGSTLGEKYPDGKIYLLPLDSGGSFNDHSSTAAPKFSDLAEYARIFFGGVPVEVLPAVSLTVDTKRAMVLWEESETGSSSVSKRTLRSRASPIQARFHTESGQFQLQADSVLARVRQELPSNAICLMALTTMDIYDTPPDLFVAGLAGANQRVGVFSLKRYNPSLVFSKEHWFDINVNKSTLTKEQLERIVLQRSCRLLVHEVAHLLGVDHCIWYSCCMNGAGHLDEDFRQPMYLCPVDLRKLHCLCGLDVTKRYENLRDFYQAHGLLEEKEWVEARLKAIIESK